MSKAPTDTKQRLIETAKDLIWRESYNAVSVDEICKKANVKKGSFYHFFRSKADLAMETMNSHMQESKAKYDDIFSPTRPPLKRFQLMIDHVIGEQREMTEHLGHVCGCPFATLGSEMAAQDEEFGEKISSICDTKATYFQSVLRDLISEGAIDKDIDIQAKSKEVFALIVGQLIMARINNDLEFLEQNLEPALRDLVGLKQPMSNHLKLTG